MLAHETSQFWGLVSWGWLIGCTKGRAICRLASQEFPRPQQREDRLRPKGRLRQQSAGDSTEENWSRAMKTKLPNSCLAESRLASTKAIEAKDGVTPATTSLSQSEIKDPSP
jgi:hypothetical protein